MTKKPKHSSDDSDSSGRENPWTMADGVAPLPTRAIEMMDFWGGLVWFCLFGLVCLVWFGLVWLSLVWFSLVWFCLDFFGFFAFLGSKRPACSLPFQLKNGLDSFVGCGGVNSVMFCGFKKPRYLVKRMKRTANLRLIGPRQTGRCTIQLKIDT